MCATSCSFCKKRASKLVPHYLCACCLVHLECWEATRKEDTKVKADCKICLEKYPEDALEQHQKMCTTRMVFRCSVCDGDYVSKEGLWNHLALHEIADEGKELHYQEIRATYKLFECALCNDQQGYQESSYWGHVHEDHDGFFLRCLDCGENFRSEKQKTEHACSQCHAREQIEPSDSTATSCSFCKKSASTLVRHYLCACCLVHLECCEATRENRLPKAGVIIIPKREEDTKMKADCKICLEKYPEDELEQHQEMCTARMVFRCSVCDGDYVSKEGLWNHLDLHEIADEGKESHYQEMRATYKLFRCALCNDQRGYQESSYWRHVHEDHDGFLLRCLYCGENFRSEKQSTEHARSQCHAREQIESSDSTALEPNQEFGKIVLPELELLSKEQGNHQESVPPEDFEMKPLILPVKSEPQENVDSFHNEDPSNIGDNGTEELLAIKSEIILSNIDESPIQPVDKKCSYCEKSFGDETELALHIETGHKQCDICGVTVAWNQLRYHKVIAHKEPSYKCSVCSMTFYYKSGYERHVAKHEKEKFHCLICGRKFRSNFDLAFHGRRCHVDKEKPDNGDQQLQPNPEIIVEEPFDVHQQARSAEGGTSVGDKPSQLNPAPVDEWNCIPCNREFYSERGLVQHNLSCHSSKPYECNVCRKPFRDEKSMLQHEQRHTTQDKRFKCELCPLQYHYRRDLKRHVQVHHEKSQFVCRYCSKTFARKDHLIRHETHHENGTARRRPRKEVKLEHAEFPVIQPAENTDVPVAITDRVSEPVLAYVPVLAPLTIYAVGPVFGTTYLNNTGPINEQLLSSANTGSLPPISETVKLEYQ